MKTEEASLYHSAGAEWVTIIIGMLNLKLMILYYLSLYTKNDFKRRRSYNSLYH